MIVVGELINSTRKEIFDAIDNKKIDFIREIAKKQEQSGASFIDVNAGIFLEREEEVIEWLVTEIQQVVSVPLCIDSPNPLAIEAGLRAHKGKALINSITGEKARFEKIAPLVTQYGASVIALCMDDKGMPETSGDRLRVADDLVYRLTELGVPKENIFFDPLVTPVSVNSLYGNEVLETIRGIMTKHVGVHTICGLSNVSFGLPKRKILNQAFLVMAMAAGLDGAILNPLDERIMELIKATEALNGRDEYCLRYVEEFG